MYCRVNTALIRSDSGPLSPLLRKKCRINLVGWGKNAAVSRRLAPIRILYHRGSPFTVHEWRERGGHYPTFPTPSPPRFFVVMSGLIQLPGGRGWSSLVSLERRSLFDNDTVMNCTLGFALLVPLKLCLSPLVPNHLKRIMCESTLGEAPISLFSPLSRLHVLRLMTREGRRQHNNDAFVFVFVVGDC